MPLDGSPEWQRYIFIAASLFLIWEIWRGWRLGAVRSLLRLTALFCAWAVGSGAAGVTGTILAFFSKTPPLLAPAIAGLMVALIIYGLISLLAGLLFKTTENHSGVIRWGFGVGGALCGVIYGLLLLWGGITLIRSLGALGELRMIQAQHEGRSIATEKQALFLARLRASLELGVTGRRLKEADPLPSSFYDCIVKASMVAGDQQALGRFLQDPATLKLLGNASLSALLQDPEVERASRTRNFLPLIRNRHVLAALEDPQLLGQLRDFNLSAVLDHALQGEEPPAAKHPPSRNSPRGPGRVTPSPAKP
jgi:hypothetical protein